MRELKNRDTNAGRACIDSLPCCNDPFVSCPIKAMVGFKGGPCKPSLRWAAPLDEARQLRKGLLHVPISRISFSFAVELILLTRGAGQVPQIDQRWAYFGT